MRNRFGFTFIELLVVMSLVGLMAGGVLINYRQTSARQTIDGASQKLRQAYTSARANALSGKKDAVPGDVTSICGTRPLDGWIVSLNTATAPVTYLVYGRCGGLTFPNPVPVESLPAGVTVAVTSGNTQILFRPLNRGTDSTVVTNVTLTSAGGTSSFAISASGELLEPTPTAAPCRGVGSACYSGGQCCSRSCSSGRCN